LQHSLAPEQIRVLTVSEKIGAKIREGRLDLVPYLAVVLCFLHRLRPPLISTVRRWVRLIPLILRRTEVNFGLTQIRKIATIPSKAWKSCRFALRVHATYFFDCFVCCPRIGRRCAVQCRQKYTATHFLGD